MKSRILGLVLLGTIFAGGIQASAATVNNNTCNSNTTIVSKAECNNRKHHHRFHGWHKHMCEGNTTVNPDNGTDNGTVTPPTTGGDNGNGTVTPPTTGGDNGNGTVTPPTTGGDNGNSTVTPPVTGGDNGNSTVTPPTTGGNNGSNTVVPPTNVGTEDNTTVSDNFMAQVEQAIFNKVNEERVKAGVAPLTYNSTMEKYARIKSQDMGENNYFSHTDLNGKYITSKMEADGVSYRAWGENIAYIGGITDPTELANKFMTNWMNSQGHRENILSTNFSSMGVGVYKIGNKVYATQEFFR